MHWLSDAHPFILELVVNVGYVLMLLGFLARDVLWLRLLLVAGQSSVVFYTLGVGAVPVAIWNGLFACINGFQVVMILRERRGVSLPAELRDFYKQTFAAFTPREFLQLWRMGTEKNLASGLLVREGELPIQLFFLLQGSLSVERSGHTLAQLKPGSFVAEMAFLTGEPASADVIAVGSEVHCMAWETAALQHWRERKPALWTKLLSVLGKDLIDKIRRADAVVAQSPAYSPESK